MSRVLHLAPLAFGLLASLALTACGKSAPAVETPPAAVYGAAPSATPVAAQPSAAAAAAPAVTPAAAVGSATLDYPDDSQMLLLAYRLAGQTPPLADWAAKSRAVIQANEFSRAEVLKRETAALEAIAASVADTGYLRLKTDSNFSEYDSERGGYYLTSFQPGTTFNFEAQGEKLGLLLTNANDAYLWPLSPAAAQDVLNKAATRSADVDMRIAISRAVRRATGLVIEGRVTDYRLIGRQYGNPVVLGSVTLAP